MGRDMAAAPTDDLQARTAEVGGWGDQIAEGFVLFCRLKTWVSEQ